MATGRGRPSRAAARAVAMLLLLAAAAGADVGAQVPDSLPPLDTSLAVDPALVQPTTPLPEAVVTHLEHLTHAFFETPGGMGLIETGMAEAAIAARAVRDAGRDSTSLGRMTSNMAHVLHAIDPNEVGTGFGLGYGFKRAASGVRTHMELAATEVGASDPVLQHAPYVVRAASGALARADEAIAMARSVQRARSAAEARPLLDRLAYLVRAMAYGDDRDGDGRIGQADAEVGLAQARYHLALVYRIEGLEMPRTAVPAGQTDTIGATGVRPR